MDYLNRQRLKVLGRIRLVADGDLKFLTQLSVTGYRARVERCFLITIEAYDWNCPKYITPRYTEAQASQLIHDSHKDK